MSSDILTCRCRNCGKTFPYLRSDAGAAAECPECKTSVLLPGNLQAIATKRKTRINTTRGLMFEIGGALLLFWYPIGTLLGPIAIYFGWRKNNALRCSNCDEPATPAATRCPNCRAAFSSD